MRQATAAVHVERIRKLCRICASPAQSYAEKKAQYRLLECKDFVNELKETFCVDVSNDSAYRHPPFFCTKCRAKLNKERYFGKGRHVSWPSPCEHGDCDMCSKNIAKGGRPKKHVIAGRPKNASDKSVDLTTEIAISTVAKLVSGAASSEPLKQWEEKLLTPLVRRKVTTAPDKRTIQCPTGGQPLTLCKVTKGRKATKDVTARTVRRRTQELEVARDLTSGGDPHLQMAHEVRRVPRDELQVMLKAVKLDQVRIPDGHLLAAKTDLHLTYHQTREVRRWLKEYGVAVESEKTSRQMAASLLEKQKVTCELLPFTTKDSDNYSTVKLFPAASVTSLTDTVQDIIKRNADEGRLTWHDGIIPEDEIWLKILGDHGGNTFKSAFQLLNRENPNSKQNTVVFSLFEAKDTRENLRTGLDSILSEVNQLEEKEWRLPDGREMNLRLFAAADYALLSNWYGISGPCGVRPCLYCEIQNSTMAKPVDERPLRELVIPKRTLPRMAAQYERFLNNGQGRIQLAKKYKNVIAPAMLNIPLDQVCIPGLHLSLGLYQKLYNMMERDLQDLDRIIASHLVTHVLQDDELDHGYVMHHHHLHGLMPYVEAVEGARVLDDKIEIIEEEIEQLENDLAYAMLRSRTEQYILSIQEDVERLMQEKTKLKSKSDKIKKEGKVTSATGPLSSLLDNVLQDHHVRRQAYHGDAFVGNHVNIMLKEQAIKDLTAVARKAAEEVVTEFDSFPLVIVTKARKIQRDYEEIFTLFSACHRGYAHANPMSEDDISTLERSIKAFMTAFRGSFPTATIPIKMHLLESHVIEWVRRWKMGLGFHGEQGIEQMHACFNKISRATCTIVDPVRRLKSTLESHLLQVSPSQKGGVPPPKPRNFKN